MQHPLLYQPQHAWHQADEETRQQIFDFSHHYRQFLDSAKTERETVQQIEEMALKQGFIPLAEAEKLGPGNKVMNNYRGKAIMMAVIGHQPLEQGCKIIGAHNDTPRLDLKPNPVYQAQDLALFKTHYYGGIKKYQWPAIPLALHGVVCTGQGETIPIVIGEDPSDPVFTITDLLPHLAKDQMKKKAAVAVEGEDLNILIGGMPVDKQEAKNPVKLMVLTILQGKYGITEEDFISAELQIVPAFKARDVGFDRSLVGAYGQDDRACVFTSLQALLTLPTPQHTGVAIFLDKEEIGSTGNTGMESRIFENFMAELLAKAQPQYSELILRRCLANSKALSADVNAGFDPNYPDVLEKNNAARLGYGVVLTKYTGARGKSSTNDAHAEFVAYVRQIFNQHQIPWQTGELGKVDQGGGGTIAYMMAAYGMDVIDCGVALLGMHSPFEVASKVDIYAAYRAYSVFLQE